jgi:hypothetical protein
MAEAGVSIRVYDQLSKPFACNVAEKRRHTCAVSNTTWQLRGHAQIDTKALAEAEQ